MAVHSVELVREFHKAFGHPIKEVPGIPSFELRKLRIRLILEELMEFVEASGFLSGGIYSKFKLIDMALANFTENNTVDERLTIDLVAAADALGDLDYVVQGGNLVWGFPAVEVIEEIHHSNMSKLGEDGKPLVREDGKILKGPNYEPPRIKEVIYDYVNKSIVAAQLAAQAQKKFERFADHPNSDHP